MSKTFGIYTIEEPTVGDMLPIMDYMENDSQKFILELSKRVIKLNGESVGEGVNQIKFSDYKAMIPMVLDAGGFGEGK